MLQRLLETEPAVLIGAVAGVLALLVTLGVVSQADADGWLKAFTAIVSGLVPLLSGLLIRTQVYPPAHIHEVARQAVPNTRSNG